MKWETKRAEMVAKLGREVDDDEFAAALGLKGGAAEYQQQMEDLRHARDALIQSCMRLVIWIAKKYKNYGVSFQDLIQEGCLGLHKATEKFDASKGFLFSTYAKWFVLQAVTESLSKDATGKFPLPSHIFASNRKIKRTESLIEEVYGRPAGISEVAEFLGMPEQRILNIRELLSRKFISLDTPVGNDLNPSTGTYEHFFATDDGIGPRAQLEKNRLRQIVHASLDRVLSEKEKTVLRMRFGLSDMDNENNEIRSDQRVHTFGAIGDSMQLSPQRVRQLEARAMWKLRLSDEPQRLEECLLRRTGC
jgi:RNA polymerase primary sigma factor